MLKFRRRAPAAALTALALAAAGAPSFAQEGNTLGPPQIRDFQLKGERRTPPAQPQAVEPTTPAPAPATTQRAPAAPAPSAQRPAERAQQPRERLTPAPTAPAAGQRRDGPAIPSQPQDVFQLPKAPAAAVPPAPVETAPQPAAVPAPDGGRPLWHYLVAAGLIVLGLSLFFRRRRRGIADADEVSAAVAAPVPPPAPRPAPVPRPWLEIEVKAERAVATAEETSVEFEILLHNAGKSVARNIRLNARLFNAGKEQDKEIGAFFRSKGEGRATHTLGDLPADERGLVQGTVTMPREEMRGLQVKDQLLFVPVLGVNVIYDWGEGRTGQTSKSYVIGRELGAESEKMGAFRLDLGPRIYRTVGQRQHSLAKRV